MGNLRGGEMSSNQITTLAVEQLRPNDYNPNKMTDDEFSEVVAEVKHLGRLPKPVIVRPNGDGFVIVDGEHGWRAANECGLGSIPCEIIEADDFEAMRQTFKRNQHGTHDPVRLGSMFRQMMEERGLSRRALAEEITVSEGTVRNALLYAEVDGLYAEARNSYAFKKTPIQDLPIRAVRMLPRLPVSVGLLWARCGANMKQLFKPWHGGDPGIYTLSDGTERDALKDHYGKVAKCLDVAPSASFDQIDKWMKWEERQILFCGLKPEDIRPYVKHYYHGEHLVREGSFMEKALGLIMNKDTRPVSFHLTPEEFKNAIDDTRKEYASASDFQDRLIMLVTEKTGKRPSSKYAVANELMQIEIDEGAPDYIRESKLKYVPSRYDLWKCDAPEWWKKEMAQEDQLPMNFDGSVQKAIRDEKHRQNIEGKTKQEHASDVAVCIVQRMLENGMRICINKDADEKEDIKVWTDGLAARLEQIEAIELLAILEAFKHDSFVKMGRVLAGLDS